MSRTFSLSSEIAAPVDRVWDWHARRGALERLVPPWERVRVVRRSGGIEDGDQTELELGLGPAKVGWLAEHRESEPGHGFTDVMISGPFASWTHRHRFEPAAGGCRLTDDVDYRLPGGSLVDSLAGPSVERRLKRSFAYRHRITASDLDLHQRYPLGGPRSFLVSGSSGLVGSALVALLSSGGHRVTRLVRRESTDPDPLGTGSLSWDPRADRLSTAGLEGFDVAVHLAGENIAAGPWTDERKARIRGSRVAGTALLAGALARTERRPGVLVCASAVGFYGDRGDVLLDEGAGRGSGFLAETCAEWEEAVEPARAAGIRVVHLRIGIVLTPAGGALARMLPVFQVGLGGCLGSGAQYWSWITLDDLLGVVLHVIANEEMDGPVNAVTPVASRNREFTRQLGRVLARPSVIPVPAPVLRLILGDMADEMLLGSARVHPGRLLDSGYPFRYPDLNDALRHVLGRVEAE